MLNTSNTKCINRYNILKKIENCIIVTSTCYTCITYVT